MVSEICRDTYYSRAIVERVLDSFVQNTMWALAHGEKVGIEGFGTFEPKARAPRTGRNPHTGAAVPIPARIMPAFKPGKQFKDAVKRWGEW